MNSLSDNRRLKIIGIGGFTSEVGKTTLLCKLLSAFPGWEAIKTTRGHYRSCGKDPQMCCVSDLLSDEPIVRSGRELTYELGKDTGRYWDAGAANVHWVIATDEQVEAGIKQALSLVKAAGVFVEGNSFTQFVKPDFFVMVADSKTLKMKRTARQALSQAAAVYVSDGSRNTESIRRFLRDTDLRDDVEFFGGDQFARLLDFIRAKHLTCLADTDNRSPVHSISNWPDNKGLTQASKD
jgi:molybdopterin-guanine dinucleotide biosynthesis protein